MQSLRQPGTLASALTYADAWGALSGQIDHITPEAHALASRLLASSFDLRKAIWYAQARHERDVAEMAHAGLRQIVVVGCAGVHHPRPPHKIAEGAYDRTTVLYVDVDQLNRCDHAPEGSVVLAELADPSGAVRAVATRLDLTQPTGWVLAPGVAERLTDKALVGVLGAIYDGSAAASWVALTQLATYALTTRAGDWGAHVDTALHLRTAERLGRLLTIRAWVQGRRGDTSMYPARPSEHLELPVLAASAFRRSAVPVPPGADPTVYLSQQTWAVFRAYTDAKHRDLHGRGAATHQTP